MMPHNTTGKCDYPGCFNPASILACDVPGYCREHQPGVMDTPLKGRLYSNPPLVGEGWFETVRKYATTGETK